MKMKKWASRIVGLFCASALFVGCLGGCNNDSGAGSTDGTDGKKIVVGFSQLGAESEWRTANTTSVQQAAEKYSDQIELKFSDAQQKQENQISAIRNYIQQGVDVIAVAPVVETGWETVLKEAKDADIPVILVDRMIKGNDVDDLYTAWIGADFEEEGTKAATWLEKYMKENNRADEELKIALLQGTTGASAQVGRTKGFEAAVSGHDNWEIIQKQSGNFTREEGKEVMEAFMKSAGDEINVLISENDDMAMGAIQAIEEAGKKPGEDIIIVSYDATKSAFEAIIEGKSNCTVECNPLSGELIMQTALDIVNGKTVEKQVYVEEDVYDATNAEANIDKRTY